jgi:hypothetical protein
MKSRLLLFVTMAMLGATTGNAVETERDRKAKQAELDAICEQARQRKIAPLREKMIRECVDNEQRPDRASCERFYADYGERTGSQDPLFYDLPECVKAHEYRRSYRQ